MSFTENLTIILLSAFSRGLGLLPRSRALTLGSALGALAWHCIVIRKKTAMANLQYAFPDWTAHQVRITARHCYRHFGRVMMDFLRCDARPAGDLEAFVSFTDESIDLLKAHRGGLIFTGHFGNWEMIIQALGLHEIPFYPVAYVQKNAGAHRFFTQLREKTGSTVIFREESALKMVRLMKKGWLGLASDQYAGKTGIRSQFFGRSTSTPAGGALFHIKTQAPMLYCSCRMTSEGHYQIQARPIQPQPLSTDKESAVQDIVQEYSNLLEADIRRHPEQYFWFHRKWKKK